MALVLNLYPTLSDTLLSRINYQATDYDFSYNNNGDTRELKSEHPDMGSTSSYHIKLSDSKAIWNAGDYDLIGNRSISIMNSNALFGKNGIAPESSKIGIALRWMCKSSNKLDTVVLGTFKYGDTSVHLDSDFVFEKGILAENIILQTILYLESPGTPDKDEKHMATDSGTLLGVLDEYNLIIEGNGSIFPILEVNEPTSALWWVRTDWEDPSVDSFSEDNVKIVLNQGHKNFKDLKLEDGIGNSPLFLEILSSALHLIILKVKESPDWEDIVRGENVETGSIGAAVYYYITTFGWNDSDTVRLALLIRESLYSKFKGD